MKELKAPDKVVRQMAEGGAVEINKATGDTANISARDAPHADSGGGVITAVAGQILAERRAAKKKAADRQNRKIYRRLQQSPRLKFTDAELSGPPMPKASAESGRAAERYGRTRPAFLERGRPPNGRLTHAPDLPKREIGIAAHNEADRRNEDGNTGVSAAHFAEKRAEGMGQKIGDGYRRLKLQPQKAALGAEEKTIKANAEAAYQRALKQSPELAGANPAKKAMQKRKIKRGYARAFRQGGTVGAKKTAAARKGAAKAKEAAASAVKFAAKHWKGLLIAGAALLLLTMLLSGLSSCGAMFGGGLNAILGTSYTAEDGDITGADADYAALERALSSRIAGIQGEYPGYDEYRLSLDEIGHDPYELASYLTAAFGSYTRGQAQAQLMRLFNRQYTLAITPVTETRYRTETRTGSREYIDGDGETRTEYYTYTVQVAYSYRILNVRLTNRSFGSAAYPELTTEQREMYGVYMETKGNKPYLFEGGAHIGGGAYTDYDIPPEALTDSAFAAMIQEAEKYLGYPYVWGGASPSTSFDCSGFVSWVVNHSGWDMGRLTANGLKSRCAVIPPGEARPGDLIFFQGTYGTAGASHVGIYVGNGMMIHCGNPISYASVNTPYWSSHFYCYGRLP